MDGDELLDLFLVQVQSQVANAQSRLALSVAGPPSAAMLSSTSAQGSDAEGCRGAQPSRRPANTNRSGTRRDNRRISTVPLAPPLPSVVDDI